MSSIPQTTIQIIHLGEMVPQPPKDDKGIYLDLGDSNEPISSVKCA